MIVSIELDGFDAAGQRRAALVAAGIDDRDIICDRRATTGAVEVEVDTPTATIVAQLAERCRQAGLDIMSINCG